MIEVPKISSGSWLARDGRDRGMSFWVDAPECMVENSGRISYARQILGDEEYPEKAADTFLVAVAPEMRSLLLEAHEAIEQGTFSPEAFSSRVEALMQKSVPPTNPPSRKPRGIAGFDGFDPRKP